MKKTIIWLVGCFMSLSLQAADIHTPAGNGQKWYGPFTITAVSNYWDGHPRVTIHVAETPNTNCASTNQKKLVTYQRTNKTYADTFSSMALAAQAQNKKVMLLLDLACHSSYGMNFHGIEVLSD